MSRIELTRINGYTYNASNAVVATITDGVLYDSYVRSDIVKTLQHRKRRFDPTIWLPPTAYSNTREARGLYTDGVYKSIPMQGIDYHGCINYTGFPSQTLGVPSISGIEQELTTKFHEKLKSQKVNYSADIVEIGQTARLVTDSVKSIASAVHYCYHGNLVKAVRALGKSAISRTLAKRWKNAAKVAAKKGTSVAAQRFLELQYGWKPLLNDCYDAADRLLGNYQQRPQGCRFKVTTHVKRPYVSKVVYSSDYNPLTQFGTYFQHEYRQDNKGFVAYKYVVWYVVNNAAAVEAASTGLTNPLSLAWEEIPFSFVADWFLPIGSMLSAIDSTWGKEFWSGTKTSFTKLSATKTATYWASANYQLVAYRIGGWMKYHSHARVVISSFPTKPGLFIKPPFSITHVSEALALLRTNLKKLL